MNVTVKKFSASWCQPCKRLAPLFDTSVKPKYADSVVFEDVDIDSDENNYVVTYQVRSVPTVIVERDGVVLERIIGSNPAHVYTDIIDAALT
jgi:thioredoxin 1